MQLSNLKQVLEDGTSPIYVQGMDVGKAHVEDEVIWKVELDSTYASYCAEFSVIRPRPQEPTEPGFYKVEGPDAPECRFLLSSKFGAYYDRRTGTEHSLSWKVIRTNGTTRNITWERITEELAQGRKLVKA